MKQGSTEWHEHRREGIGSSDAPIILGVSPFKTPHQLYLEKIGRAKSDVSNWATERGNRLEPVARARYELLTGIDFPPFVIVNKNVPELRASLDGYNVERNIVLEIKVPGERVFNLAKCGVVAEEYEPQLLHQQIVTECEEVHFYCVKVEGKGMSERIVDDAVVIYKGSDEKRLALINAERDFWQMVINRRPPPLTEQDCLEVSDAANLDRMSKVLRFKTQYERLRKEAETARETLNEATEEVTRALNHPRIRGAGVELVRVNAKQPFWKVRIL
jgi:putative phage-type endonuclease